MREACTLRLCIGFGGNAKRHRVRVRWSVTCLTLRLTYLDRLQATGVYAGQPPHPAFGHLLPRGGRRDGMCRVLLVFVSCLGTKGCRPVLRLAADSTTGIVI